MSENGNGHRPTASISTQARAQAWRRGELEECVKRVAVEAEVSEAEEIGEVRIVEVLKDGTVILENKVPQGIWAGKTEKDGTTSRVELAVATLARLSIEAILPISAPKKAAKRKTATARRRLPDSGHVRVRLATSAVRDFRLPDASQQLPETQKLSADILKLMRPGFVLRALVRRSWTEYYGTLVIVPQRVADARAKRARLETIWRRDNSWPDDSPLPDKVTAELIARGECGTVVIGFEDFRDDSGEIPSTLPGGSLNEDALAMILQIQAFRGPLAEVYSAEQMEVDQWLFFQRAHGKLSPSTSPGQTPSDPASHPN